MMPRDCCKGGVLRETQSRESESVPNTGPHFQSTPIISFEFNSDHNSELRRGHTTWLSRSVGAQLVNTTGLRTHYLAVSFSRGSASEHYWSTDTLLGCLVQ